MKTYIDMRKIIERAFLLYIRIFAKLQLAKINPDIIGITGSSGKTSVRDAVATILRTKYKIKVTGKANSETGIPLDILGLEMKSYSLLDWIRVSILSPIMLLTNWENYEKYVVEMGIDSPDDPKNMSYLLKIVQPSIGVFINAAAVHSEPFDYLNKETDPIKRLEVARKLIALEKGKLIKSLPADGHAILNFDDKNVKNFAKNTSANVIGVGENADISISGTEIGFDGFSTQFKYKKKSEKLSIPGELLGRQYANTFALAIGVGIASGIEFEECVDALKEYRPPRGRMSLIKGIKNSYIIDSSYNSSVSPLIEALNTLGELGRNKRKIAVLGDMREMGEEEEFGHQTAAEYSDGKANYYILIGPAMKKYFGPKLIEQDIHEDDIKYFENTWEAGEYVKGFVEEGDVILVKGSQNTLLLEIIVEMIMAEPDKADELLCRRGEYWAKRREELKKV